MPSPAVGLSKPADHADRRRFAGAVRAEEADDLAFRDFQIDVLHGRLVAEALGQAMHVDDGGLIVHRERRSLRTS